MRIPELITEKFTLRSLRESDLDELVHICTDPETVRWTTIPLNYTRDDARTFLNFTQRAAAAGRELTWAIDYSGVLAGVVTLRLPGGLRKCARNTRRLRVLYGSPDARARHHDRCGTHSPRLWLRPAWVCPRHHRMDGVGGEYGIRTGGGKGRIHEYYQRD